MVVEQMSREECLDFIGGKRLVRLACAHENQPYVMPIHVARDGDRLYAFTTTGQKIEWMRENPLVCVEADESASLEKWCSVVAFGRYVELQKTSELEDERRHAHALLWQGQRAWEPGYARTILQGKQRALEPLYFRIEIGEVTGRRAVPESPAAEYH